MKKFSQWLIENTASEIGAGMGGIGDAVRHNMDLKNLEYAKRIIAGEDPNVVMQGIKVNGTMWQRVMEKVAELKAQQQPSSNNQQFSVSGLEKKLGLASGSLDVRPSDKQNLIFVRNRTTGQYKAVSHNVQDIENAAKELFQK